jgi:hypothetical protein
LSSSVDFCTTELGLVGGPRCLCTARRSWKHACVHRGLLPEHASAARFAHPAHSRTSRLPIHCTLASSLKALPDNPPVLVFLSCACRCAGTGVLGVLCALCSCCSHHLQATARWIVRRRPAGGYVWHGQPHAQARQLLRTTRAGAWCSLSPSDRLCVRVCTRVVCLLCTPVS